MKYKILLLFSIIMSSFASRSQIEEVIWQNCLGAEDGYNYAEAAVKTDNGYMFGIQIFNDGPGISNFHGGADAWIVNVDSNGNVIWERCYGGSSGEGPHKIIRIDDNTYYLFNHASSIDGDVHQFQGKDFWMVRINANGEILWENSYGGSANGEIAVDAILMPEKGALMMGRISSSGGDVTDSYGDMDVWLCRIDSLGTIIWQKTIGNLGKDNGLKLKQTSHNSILFIGGHEVTGGMIDCPDFGYYIRTDVWIVEMNMNGNFLNQWCYGGMYYDLGFDIIEVQNGYVIAASTYSNDRDVSGFHGTPGGIYDDIWIFKIDFFGNLQWQRCLGGTSTDYPVYLTDNEDGGIIVLGDTKSHDGDVTGNHTTEWYETDIWVVKLSSDGQLIWEHCFGGLGTDRFEGIHSVVKKDDYNYVIGANSDHASGDVTCDLYPNDESANAWILEIKDCNYYAPHVPMISTGPDTLCTVADPISIYSTNSANWATGYEWTLEPENAGVIAHTDTNAQITWNPLFEGTVMIKARSYNDCGFSDWSEPYVTQVYSCIGIEEETGGKGEEGKRGALEIWPNPARDIVDCRWPMVDGRGEVALVIYDMFGREMPVIASPSPAMGEGRGGGWRIDASALPPGLYLVVQKDGNSIIGSAKLVVGR